MRVEHITPLIAAEYLTLERPGNRKRNPTVVRNYRTDMLAGEFKLTGEAIQFSKDGYLINGANRMEALAGIDDPSFSVSMVVIRGLDNDVYRYMDNGWKRTAAQVAATSNIPQSSMVAAIARLLCLFESGASDLRAKGGKGVAPTRIQVLRCIEANNEMMQRAATVADSCRDLVMQSVSGFCYCIFYKKSGPATEEFFERLRTGLELTENHPVYQLRKRLIANRAQASKLHQTYLIALFFVAFRAFLDGRQLRRVDWKKGADFPSI